MIHPGIGLNLYSLVSYMPHVYNMPDAIQLFARGGGGGSGGGSGGSGGGGGGGGAAWH
jgi:hypothetical protein